ncbi:Cytoplasmic dynein 2 heavy chain 1 [Liparis tanakae]|uniref:Cytoplasmic dynein 2 heavy chain 1 n=1 Tax=Liparis tanakae TaxID=230148 RepID=A0A4Z2DZF1_9TELE|nr:Cytoplasmic dynein 2 heavy chain 1 [Liparis tanakae]
MKETLKHLLSECLSAGQKGEVDPSCYPSQILCLAEQIRFTEDVERALREQQLPRLQLELRAKLEHYTAGESGADLHATTGTVWGCGWGCVCGWRSFGRFKSFLCVQSDDDEVKSMSCSHNKGSPLSCCCLLTEASPLFFLSIQFCIFT